ncbi:hypothetical protein [Alicycliphilus denitrificans]|uniref:hypothetical protein n=1 Tax=Alicycliphilus denitrificans TaxID=179636 RepID=UPI0001D9F2A3|nr:hypothetical protein [Alicycliphilus denitrificans]ADU99841.1 hypothetical protein Alide_2098 [Alicycliphilus denitrificans BC]
MSLESRIIALAQAIGTDIKAIKVAQGTLSALNTTNKSSLVAAINELMTLISGSGATIDDNAGNGNTAATWSADKIYDSIEAAKMAVKSDLINGAGAALDTLNELAAALGNDPSFAATIAGELANRVRYDAAQALTSPQQAQARSNIGAAAASDATALATGLGSYDRDYAADYAAAKA